MRPWVIFTCGRSVLPISGRPRTTTLLRLVGSSSFGSEFSTTTSFETSAWPSGPRATSGEVSISEAWSRKHAALHLGLAALADHHDVVGGSGRDQRRLQPGVEHQHGRKDEHHQRHAAGGQRGRQLAHPQVARDITERNFICSCGVAPCTIHAEVWTPTTARMNCAITLPRRAFCSPEARLTPLGSAPAFPALSR